MRSTNFAKYLTDFLGTYLEGERGCSPHTVSAYRDALTLFLIFMRDTYNIGADRIDFKDITQERVIAFLGWLETERKDRLTKRVKFSKGHRATCAVFNAAACALLDVYGEEDEAQSKGHKSRKTDSEVFQQARENLFSMTEEENEESLVN